MLSDFQFCPRYYFYRHVLGYRPKEDKSYFLWGTTIHKFYEEAEKKLAEGSTVEVAGMLAIQAAMMEWVGKKDPNPEDKKWAFQTRSRMSDVLVAIAKEWLKEKAAKTIHVLFSEIPYNLQLDNGQWICGRIDQGIQVGNRLYVRDFKTTTKKWQWYRNSLNPADQFVGYTYALSTLSSRQIDGAYVDVIYTTKDEGPKFYREIIPISPATISRWKQDWEYWAEVMELARRTDNYVQNTRNCQFCSFIDVCRTNPQSEEFMLKSKFVFDPWDPSE